MSSNLVAENKFASSQLVKALARLGVPFLRGGAEDEEIARGLYGFTKRLGEEVCRNAWVRDGLSVNALRMCHPVSQEKFLEQARWDKPSISTAAEDVARLMLAAVDYSNGFQAFLTSGDYENKILNMDKAKRLLGWEPLARPVQ